MSYDEHGDVWHDPEQWTRLPIPEPPCAQHAAVIIVSLFLTFLIGVLVGYGAS